MQTNQDGQGSGANQKVLQIMQSQYYDGNPSSSNKLQSLADKRKQYLIDFKNRKEKPDYSPFLFLQRGSFVNPGYKGEFEKKKRKFLSFFQFAHLGGSAFTLFLLQKHINNWAKRRLLAFLDPKNPFSATGMHHLSFGLGKIVPILFLKAQSLFVQSLFEKRVQNGEGKSIFDQRCSLGERDLFKLPIKNMGKGESLVMLFAPSGYDCYCLMKTVDYCGPNCDSDEQKLSLQADYTKVFAKGMGGAINVLFFLNHLYGVFKDRIKAGSVCLTPQESLIIGANTGIHYLFSAFNSAFNQELSKGANLLEKTITKGISKVKVYFGKVKGENKAGEIDQKSSIQRHIRNFIIPPFFFEPLSVFLTCFITATKDFDLYGGAKFAQFIVNRVNRFMKKPVSLQGGSLLHLILPLCKENPFVKNLVDAYAGGIKDYARGLLAISFFTEIIVPKKGNNSQKKLKVGGSSDRESSLLDQGNNFENGKQALQQQMMTPHAGGDQGGMTAGMNKSSLIAEKSKRSNRDSGISSDQEENEEQANI